MTTADQVEEALAQALCAELKLDETRARYIAHRALDARLTEGTTMYGMDGKGLFARSVAHNDPTKVAKHFRWICAPIIGDIQRSDGSMAYRQPLNRDRAWYAELKAAGLGITTFDALPKPGNYMTGLADAIEYTALVGGTMYVLDAEKDYMGQPAAAVEIVANARQLCNAAGIRLGFTSYGGPWNAPSFPWAPFCKGTDLSIPQTYDSDGHYDPSYMPHAIAAYAADGAPRISLGLGLFQNHAPPGHDPHWRTPAQLQAHLALVPPNVTSVIFWPLGDVPDELLTVLDAWHPPADSTIREALSSLTPFGRFTRD